MVNMRLLQLWCLVIILQTRISTTKGGDCSDDLFDGGVLEFSEVEITENVTYTTFMAEMALTKSRILQSLNTLPNGAEGPSEGSFLRIDSINGVLQLVTKVSKEVL